MWKFWTWYHRTSPLLENKSHDEFETFHRSGYKRTDKCPLQGVVTRRLLRGLIHLFFTSLNKMKVSILFFFIAIQSSAWAHINFHGQPLLTGATSFTYEISTWTSTKPTVCFVTNDRVSQCRRRRGIEETPQMIGFHGDVAPSQVLR